MCSASGGFAVAADPAASATARTKERTAGSRMLAEAFLQPGRHLFGVVAERTGLPFVDDRPRFVDDVESLGPPRVDGVGAVVDRVHEKRELEPEALHEVVRDPHAILGRFGLGIADVVLHVRVHLPLVEWVRFTDVDREEAHAVAVLAVQILDALDRAPEGRSRETPENEDGGAAT